MQRRFLISTAALSLVLAASVSARGIDVDKINGSIQIESGQQAGDLSTINGSIRIADGASAAKVSTVNGSIKVGRQATVDSLETVNGGLDLGEGARVAHTIEAVNGSVTLGKGTDVAGHVSNVNGRFTLDAAHVGGGLETVSGDIEIGANSRIEGGLLVDRQSGWFNWGNRKPRIVIGPHAVVEGKLEFRREVELLVSDSATVGEIVGATPQRFSGDRP